MSNQGRKNVGNAAAAAGRRVDQVEARGQQVHSQVGFRRTRYAVIGWHFDATDASDRSKGLIVPNGDIDRVTDREVWIDWLTSCRPQTFGDVVYEIEWCGEHVDRGGTTLQLYRALRPMDATVGTFPTTATVVHAGSAARATIGEIAVATTGVYTENRIPLWRSHDFSDLLGADLFYQVIAQHPYALTSTLALTGAWLQYNAAGEAITVLGMQAWMAVLSRSAGLAGSVADSNRFNAGYLAGIPILPSSSAGTGRGTPVAAVNNDLMICKTDPAADGTKRWEPISSTDLATLLGVGGGGGGGLALGDPWDFLRMNSDGDAWEPYSLGDLDYFDDSTRIVIGNNFNGLGPTDLAIKHRLLLGPDMIGPDSDVSWSSSIEWLVRGNEADANDKWARILVVDNNVSFQDDGTEVLSWVCSATAGDRQFTFAANVDVEGKDLTVDTGNIQVVNSNVRFDDSSILEFIYNASPEYLATIRVAGGEIVFRDNGSDVLLWHVHNSTPSLRYFVFYPKAFFNGGVAVGDHSITDYLQLTSPADHKWVLADGVASYLTMDSSGASPLLTIVPETRVNGKLRTDTKFNINGTDGVAGPTTITLAKTTTGGTTGSLTITGGIITAATNPT